MAISKSGYCALVWVPALVSTFVVLARIYVRVKSRIIGTDDYLMVIASGFFLCYAILNQAQYSSTGTTDLDEIRIITIGTMASVVSILALLFGRTSVGYLLLRIVPSSMKWLHWFVRFTLGGLWILTFLYMIAAFFPYCTANVVALGSELNGCLHTAVLNNFIAATNWYSVFVDLAFTVLPVTIISQLRIRNKGKKLALAGLLSLGLLATIFLILRAASAYAGWSSATNSVVVPLSTAMEQALILIGGSLVTLMPLYRYWSAGIAITPRNTPQPPTFGGETKRPFAGNNSVSTVVGSQKEHKPFDEKPDGILVERDFRVRSAQAENSPV